VHISGDVDMASETDLAQVMTHLNIGQRRTIYIDLADVTFAGTTLLTVIARVYAIGGEQTTLVLCRPSPATRRLIDLTGLDAIATIRDDLPGDRDRVDTTPPRADSAGLDSQRQLAA
jgi:anti-anti-sigma factor